MKKTIYTLLTVEVSDPEFHSLKTDKLYRPL